jgi:hypothetical protein
MDGTPVGIPFVSGFDFPFQSDTLPQQIFNFLFTRVRMLVTDAFSCDVASQLMQVQGDLQTLFARHRTIPFDLFVQGRFRSHGTNVACLPQRGYVIQPSVGAKRLRWVCVKKKLQPQRGCSGGIGDWIQPLQG